MIEVIKIVVAKAVVYFLKSYFTELLNLVANVSSLVNATSSEQIVGTERNVQEKSRIDCYSMNVNL